MEPTTDFIVHVDRSVKPSYPDRVGVVRHPELELEGPPVYNLQDGVEQWLHGEQQRYSVRGSTIYEHLQGSGALSICLNLQDGLAIQQKGALVFHELFADQQVFLFGSVTTSEDDGTCLYVPYLYEAFVSGEIVLSWFWIRDPMNRNHRVLRFSK